jgi:hypothetical protein
MPHELTDHSLDANRQNSWLSNTSNGNIEPIPKSQHNISAQELSGVSETSNFCKNSARRMTTRYTRLDMAACIVGLRVLASESECLKLEKTWSRSRRLHGQSNHLTQTSSHGGRCTRSMNGVMFSSFLLINSPFGL